MCAVVSAFRISAKNLGQLALESFCPRCFWIRLRRGGKFPYAVFPGIFSSIDSYSKRVTALHVEQIGRLPPWFSKAGIEGTPLPGLHHSKFRLEDAGTSVALTGVPDEVIRLRDGRLFIADYKTARFTDAQDELLPMYQTQLNGYAWIAEGLGMGRVMGLGLVYYEPATEIGPEDEALIEAEGFLMRFRAKVVPVALDTSTIPALIRRAREMFDAPEAPPGRAGCGDCRLLDALVATATGSYLPRGLSPGG